MPARPVKLDLSIVLGLVAGATDSIGLGATYSTTYYSPFHVARTFATLDQPYRPAAGVARSVFTMQVAATIALALFTIGLWVHFA